MGEFDTMIRKLEVVKLLSSNERLNTRGVKPVAVVLHHTAGWENPTRVVSSWETDSRGPVATHYVVGGQDIRKNKLSTPTDGLIVRCLPLEGANGWHVGGGPRGQNNVSIGIELCNFGYLKNGRTYTNVQANEEQITTLGKPFRGYSDWHTYSHAQLQSLALLLYAIRERYDIDIKQGLPSWLSAGTDPIEAFDRIVQSERPVAGLYSHTNFRRDKYDVSPQPELVEMLKNLV
jgi:N-acetyl-anhydromuramyl-L-alanine amidase AmpD